MASENGGILAAVVRSSLRFRGAVIALACLFLGYGLYTLAHMKYDVFPEFAPPQVSIQTEAPGLSPEQVEVLVTQPIENTLNGVAGVESLRSSSIQGLSVINVIFHVGSDVYLDRQVVSERLAAVASQLPAGVGAPALSPLTSSTADVMGFGLYSEKLDLLQLRTIADWTVRLRLLAVPGVANVAIFGGEVRQLQIQILPDKLIQHDLSLDDVLNAARRSTAIRGAGFVENSNQRVILQTEGQSLASEELAKVILVQEHDAVVRLGDVARVVEGPAPPISAGTVMGHPGAVLMVRAQYGSNTLEVNDAVDKALNDMLPTLEKEGVHLVPGTFRAANFIHTSVYSVQSALLHGGILVVIVLFVFLFSLRTAAISCLAIPLSLLGAVTVMHHIGYSLNTMTLGGLAISIGLVVDDAVITVENILRRIRENRSLPAPRPVMTVVLRAALEVRSSVVYATITVAVVFVPVLMLSGMAGRIFAPLAVAYILATFTSLVVALTVTPALCLLFFGRPGARLREQPLVGLLKRVYSALLGRVERHPHIVIGGVLVLSVAAAAAIPFFGGGFLPDLKENHAIVHITAVSGTSLNESVRMGQAMTREFLKLPHVRTVAQRVGRAAADDTFGPHTSEFNVDFLPLTGRQAEAANEGVREVLEGFPGITFEVNNFLTERIDEILSGYTAAVIVNIFGNDLDVLDDKARDVTRVLAHMPGATDVQLQSPPGTPQLVVRLRKDDLIRWGLAPVDVLDILRTAYQGDVVGQVYQGNRVFDVSVILPPNLRRNVDAVGSLPLRSPAGNYVFLRQVADIYETSGRYVLLHESAQRVQTVTCNVTGSDIGGFVEAARKEIARKVSLPAGYYVEFSGEAEEQKQSRRDLLIHSIVAGIGILLLLSVTTGSTRNFLLILVNVPFALVGGVLAVFFTGGWLSTGSLVGFVTLFGITLRNSMMMISHYEHLVAEEGMTWGPEAALRGASERLAPILMTALATALGLLPLALGSGEPGREIEGPMALVILGGLATSTILNLLVLPTLALRFGKFERPTPEA